MAVTRLKRKDRRNKARAANRIQRIRQLTRTPVIKKLDAPQAEASSEEKVVASKEVVAAVDTTEDQTTEQQAEETNQEEE